MVLQKNSELEAPIYGMELNAATPSGLFESDTGDRYLVGHDSIGMIAVALRHRTKPSFAWTLLSPQPIATGVWLGNGELVLTHSAPAERDEELGTLVSEDWGWISLRCQQEGTELSWRGIAGTSESMKDGSYDGWRITKWGKTFFEQTPPHSDFPIVLPFYLLQPANEE